jgi:hypothetical protein
MWEKVELIFEQICEPLMNFFIAVDAFGES